MSILRTTLTISTLALVAGFSSQTATAGSLDFTNCGNKVKVCVYDGNDNMVGSGAAAASQSKTLASGERRTLKCGDNECHLAIVPTGHDCITKDGGADEWYTFDTSNRYVRYRKYTGFYDAQKSSQSSKQGDNSCKKEITHAWDRYNAKGSFWGWSSVYAELTSYDWVTLETSRGSWVTASGGFEESVTAERPADREDAPVSESSDQALRFHRADGQPTDCFQSGDIVNIETASGRYIYGWSNDGVYTRNTSSSLGDAYDWELLGGPGCINYFSELRLVNERFGTELIGGYTSTKSVAPAETNGYEGFVLKFYLGEGGIPFSDIK